MQTTATYDQDADEFVVNTPTTLAQKYWITNGEAASSDARLTLRSHAAGVGEVLLLRRRRACEVCGRVRSDDHRGDHTWHPWLPCAHQG